MTDNRLKSLADRIETLMDERDGIQSDIRDIYTEAKSAGYVPKVLRKAITRKRMDPDKRSEEDTILDLYEGALSPKMRRAVEMARSGASAREIETETGIDQATVARSVSLNKKAETEESCGGVESRHAGGISGEVTTGNMPGGQPSNVSTPRVDRGETPAGVATGPHDTSDDDLTIPAHLRGPSPANRRVV